MAGKQTTIKTEWIDLKNRSCRVEWVNRRGQKYMRIRVRADRVVVSGPGQLGRKALQKYLADQADWVEEKLKLAEQKQARNREKLEDFRGRLMVRGSWMPVDVMSRRGGRPEGILWEREGRIEYHLPAGERPQVISEEARAHFFRNMGRKELVQQCRHWAEQIEVKFNRVYIRSQQTKWGSCSSKKNLSMNWRIMQLPGWVRKYLVIHELCHLRHFNHSPAFWRCVDEHFPARLEAETWLNRHETLLFSDPLL